MKNVFVPDTPARLPIVNLAVVETVEAGGVTLRFEGEAAARTKVYKRLASYTPTAGDRVYIVPVSGTYIVIGEVI